MNRHSVSLITATLGAAILLGGCTAPSALAAFDRRGAAEDKMPEGITFEGTDVRTDSARLLAAKDGVKYFAAKNEGSHEACLVIVPEANSSLSVAGCGSFSRGGAVVTVGSAAGVSAVLVADVTGTGRRQPKGWVQVHDNVLISRR